MGDSKTFGIPEAKGLNLVPLGYRTGTLPTELSIALCWQSQLWVTVSALYQLSHL